MAITIDTDFPGGGVANVEFLAPDHVRFQAPLDESPQSLWYYFRICDAKDTKLLLTQKDLEHVLGVHESRGYSPVCPVFRDGEHSPWERINEKNISFSEDPLEFTFTLIPKTDSCYVAFCFPYTLEDFDFFLKGKNSDLIKKRIIGKTGEGRDYPMILIGEPENPAVSKMAVFTTRVHAGETPGSFVLEGLLNRLLADSPDMMKVLQTTLFCIFPMVDLDSVQVGRYGKDRFPCDFNRDWKTEPYHVEIKLIQEAVDELSRKYEILSFCDLHAPQPGAASYYVPNRALPNSPCWNKTWNFAIAFENNCKGKKSFHLEDVDPNVLNWGGKNNPAFQTTYFTSIPCDLAMCFEFSYHRNHEDGLIYPDDWRELGSILMQTLIDSVYLEDKLSLPCDTDRIPPWTIPFVWKDWESLNIPKNLEVQDSEDSLELIPSGLQNEIKLTTNKFFPVNGRTGLKISSPGFIQAEIYCVYYRENRFVCFSKSEFAASSTGEILWKPPAAPQQVDSYKVSIWVRNLKDNVRICFQNDKPRNLHIRSDLQDAS